jgi:hypothetical protein
MSKAEEGRQRSRFSPMSGAWFLKKTKSSSLRCSGYKQQNQIRAVVEWKNGSIRSEPKAIILGITVALNLFGKLIEHGEQRAEPFHTLFALIDESTSALPVDHCFNGNFVGRMKTGEPFVMPLSSCNDDGSVTIRGAAEIDWFKPLGFAYSGPDDPLIVKTIVSGRPESP